MSSPVVRVWVLILAIAAAALGLWTFGLDRYGPLSGIGGVPVPWWGLVAAFYLAEANVVHLFFRNQAHSLSASEVGLVLGLFFADPAGLLAGQVLGAGMALVAHRRQKPVKLAFNLAELALAAGIALLVFRSLIGPHSPHVLRWAAALAAAAIAHITGVLLVSLVMALAEGRVKAPPVTRTVVVSLLGALAMTSLGLLAVELIIFEPLAMLLLAGPVLACGISLRAYWQQRQERERVEFLYESMRATQGAPEFGLAVGQLLVGARRLLRADHAEILLLPPTQGEPPLRSVSGPHGEMLMQVDASAGASEQALRHAELVEHPVLLPSRREPHPLDEFLASRGLPDAIIGVLRGERRVMGLLVVGGRVSDVSTFAAEDVTLFETFSGHASVLLENGRLERSLARATELKEELSHQAYHDALTGLPNRLLFNQRVTEALAGLGAPAGTHSVLFLDLNRFKEVNDTWGHSAGDELLQHVADRICECLRPSDIPARLGGDEFAVLLPDTEQDGAERLAGRLIAAISTPITLSVGHRTIAHASVGIAVTGPDATTAEELLRNADLAMYTAKHGDVRLSHYRPDLHIRIRRDREVARELRTAVERGEIIAHFQPVVSLADGTIQAFEALARWQHPRRGLLLPQEFLHVAEECGLITQVGAAVREHAFRCATQWQDAHPQAGHIGLWVNVSPAELGSDRLLEDLALALTRAHLDAKRLTVEITESTVFHDEDSAQRAMNQLREIGVHLSIDDFGTGYSSLSRLAEFPIEMLKIPKPFVDRLNGDRPDATFVDAILRLAGSLGLTTCSEGIEDAAQARRLTDLGCGLAQGFYFSRPLSHRHALRLLRANAAGESPPALHPDPVRTQAFTGV